MQNLNNFPKTVVKPAQCPNCGKEFDYTVYPEITIPGNNKLKKQVMNTSINLECQKQMSIF